MLGRSTQTLASAVRHCVIITDRDVLTSPVCVVCFIIFFLQEYLTCERATIKIAPSACRRGVTLK